jgi:hypothetical protein
MAKYFLLIRVLSRGKGARATRSAAYRAGETIRDERSGQSYNFSDRGDVLYKEIVLPSQLTDMADMGWARDRSTLWNAAEHAGRQRNSRVAREVLVMLPAELTPSQRTNLVRTFARDLADKYRNAVDVAIHPPRAGSDERNHHAHLLTTTREVTANGLGPRTMFELNGEERQARGLGPHRNEYFSVRERWAQVTNEALHEAGLAARIDHRSYRDQGIDREPMPTIPRKVYYAERKSGKSTRIGDDIRARHRERVEARLKGGDELNRVLQRQKELDRHQLIERSKQTATGADKVARSAPTRQELNRRQLEWHHANKERVNERRRELYRENTAVERQKQRTYRQKKAEQINERRRQLRAANAEKLNERARERWALARERRQVAAKALAKSTLADPKGRLPGQNLDSPATAESARNWLDFKKTQKPTPTAEESARNWLESRKTRKPAPTAEESARNWLESRQRQAQAHNSDKPVEQRSQQRGIGVNDDELPNKAGRSHDYDHEL